MFSNQGSQRLAGVFRTVQSQPSWISRAALLVFVLVIGIPILLLALLAVFAAVVVFGMLSLFHGLTTRLRGLMPRNDGRANVRVMHRVE